MNLKPLELLSFMGAVTMLLEKPEEEADTLLGAVVMTYMLGRFPNRAEALKQIDRFANTLTLAGEVTGVNRDLFDSGAVMGFVNALRAGAK